MHKERFINEEHFRVQFKPIIDPLERFIENKEQLLNIDSNSNNGHPEVQEIQTDEHEIFDKSTTSNRIASTNSRINNEIARKSPCSSNKSLTLLKSFDDCEKILNTEYHDSRFGVRKLRNDYKIGRNIVKFSNNIINVKNKNFKLTDGLRNLLFLKSPKVYSKHDLSDYKQILLLTEATDLNLDRKSDINNIKFKEIIQPLLKIGSGIQTEYMLLNKENQHTDYTYWDDPNELIERLRLLVSSNSAGHNAHNNEILSIIEELKEADIIS